MTLPCVAWLSRCPSRAAWARGSSTPNKTPGALPRPTDMRITFSLILPLLAALSYGQSVIYEFRDNRVPYEVVYTGFAPLTTVTGVSILRSNKDWNGFWAALNGHPGLRNARAPRQYRFKDEQLIAIVLPPNMRYDAKPTVARISERPRGKWRLDVFTLRGTEAQGVGSQVPYVIVRTPKGPDDLDVVLHGRKGDVVLKLRSRRHGHGKPDGGNAEG